MKNTIKAVTLIGFVVLLAGFVAYKAGFYDLKEDAPVGSIKEITPDTIPGFKKDSLRISPSMLPTSKSGVVIDQKVKFKAKDSVKKDSTKKKAKR